MGEFIPNSVLVLFITDLVIYVKPRRDRTMLFTRTFVGIARKLRLILRAKTAYNATKPQH
jgi:hypothetical protein